MVVPGYPVPVPTCTLSKSACVIEPELPPALTSYLTMQPNKCLVLSLKFFIYQDSSCLPSHVAKNKPVSLRNLPMDNLVLCSGLIIGKVV